MLQWKIPARSLCCRILAFGMLFLLAGCPKPPELPPLYPPVPESELSTEEVSRIINARAAAFRNMRGLGKVRIQTWEERYKFSEVFVLEQPRRFRLETLGAFEQPAIFLTSDENLLSLYSKRQNTYYEGVASQENFFRLSGINLSIDNAILALSGNPPQLSPVSLEWGFLVPGTQQYYLERISVARDTIQRIWFDSAYHVIAYMEEYMLSNGELLLRLKFDNYRAEEGGYPLPQNISIDRPLDNTRVNINYTFFEANQAISEDTFIFTPPQNAVVRYIDDVNAEQIEQLAPYQEFRTKE